MMTIKSNPVRIVLGAIGMCLLITSGGTSARGQPADDTIRAIQKSWSARQQRIHSTRVSWVEMHTVVRGHVTDTIGRLPDGARRLQQMGITPGSIVPPEDTTFDITATFSFDGKKARLDYEDRQWSAKENAYVPRPEVVIYDGDVSTRFLPQGTSYTPWPFGSRQGRNPFQSWLVTGPIVMALCPLNQELRLCDIHDLEPTGQRAVIDGRPCLELQGRTGNTVRHIWVDPSRDFIMVRYLTTVKEQTRSKIDVHYGKKMDGEWVPEGWQRITFQLDHRLARSTRAKVTALQLNRQADPGEFELKFPERTLVRDYTRPGPAVRYLVEEGGKERMIPQKDHGVPYEQLINREPQGLPSKTWSIFSSPSIWAGTVALVTGGWLVWRRWRFRRSARSPAV